MTKISSKKIIDIIAPFVKENWGSPFIFTFMLLLSTAGVFLITGSASHADTVAVYAFYALLIGVVLQLYCFLKNRSISRTEGL